MKKLISGLLLVICVGAPATQAGNGNVNLALEFKTKHRSCQEIVDKLNQYRSEFIVLIEHEQIKEAKHVMKKIEKKEEKLRECEKQQKKDRHTPTVTGGTGSISFTF